MPTWSNTRPRLPSRLAAQLRSEHGHDLPGRSGDGRHRHRRVGAADGRAGTSPSHRRRVAPGPDRGAARGRRSRCGRAAHVARNAGTRRRRAPPQPVRAARDAGVRARLRGPRAARHDHDHHARRAPRSAGGARGTGGAGAELRAHRGARRRRCRRPAVARRPRGPGRRAPARGGPDPALRAHPERARHWLTAACNPRNEASRLARGRWIADADDDDTLRPDAVAGLLGLARERHLEVAYGIKEQHAPSGATDRIGAFPPRPREPDWREQGLPYQPWDGGASCGALVHAGVDAVFAREHVAADLGVPGDFFRLERMLRAGVRFGMLDEVVYDYFPSTLWQR